MVASIITTNEFIDILVKMASSLAPIAETWPDGFYARRAILCRYWTCSFSGSLARLLMPEPLPFSLFFQSFWVMFYCFRLYRNIRCKYTKNVYEIGLIIELLLKHSPPSPQ
jgi:hypothetical protein